MEAATLGADFRSRGIRAYVLFGVAALHPAARELNRAGAAGLARLGRAHLWRTVWLATVRSVRIAAFTGSAPRDVDGGPVRPHASRRRMT
jgi:hypothetical protein